MKAGRVLAVIAVWGVLIFSAGTAGATPDARILYQETELESGLWQYDYTFSNTSDSGEYIFNVWLDLNPEAEVTGLPLPEGWVGGTVWEGTNVTSYLDPASADYIYDIPAGNSLVGFSFIINYQAGGIPFAAYFDDHAGNMAWVEGTTAAAVVPEPVSTVLFFVGGTVLAARCLWNRVQMKFLSSNY